MDKWMSTFCKAMFGNGHTFESMDRAARIKYEHMPDILYKYRSSDERSIEAFENDVIYSAPATTFNDLREVPLVPTEKAYQKFIQGMYAQMRKINPELPCKEPLTEKELIEIISGYYKGIVNKEWSTEELQREALMKAEIQTMIKAANERFINDAQRAMQEAYNIYCLTTAYDNELMWAHYANDYQGFCIGYSIKELGEMDPIVQFTFPVIYGKEGEIPEIKVDDIDDVDGSLMMFASLLKCETWKKEDEWRIFFPARCVNATVIKTGKAESFPYAKAVYLGNRIDCATRKRLLEICTAKGIEAYQMDFNRKARRLEPVQVL